ncbi:MAG: polyketide synthase dehydratase domain-containing protein, partial [Burkholderiales bacterium]
MNANRLPYLPDHRVQGLMVLPGSAYAELGLAIHHEISGQAQGVLEDVEFHKALVIDEQHQPILRVTYDKGTRDYAVYSQRTKGKTWHLHARGKLSLIPPAQRAQVRLDEIQKRCTEFIDGDTHYKNMRERGFQYGPYFQGVHRLWLGSGGEEVLAWIAGYDRLMDNDQRNRLHPTIFDAALQILLAPLGAKGDTELYIPVGIRQLKLYSVPKNRFWCYGKLKQSSQSVAGGDIVLFDEEGNVVAEARGVRAKALTRKDKKDKDELKQIDQWLYEFAWEKTATETVPRRAGRWLVFMDRGGNGERLVERLRAAGADEVIQVLPAETFQERSATKFLVKPDSKADLRRVLNKGRDVGIEGIVYLWGLDTPNDYGGLVGISSMVVPAVQLIQALAQQYSANPPRLVVVTRGAQSVDRNNLVEAVTQAPLIGLMRVAVNEYPDVRLRAIDIDHDIDTLSSLSEEILSDSPEDELALRGAQRYVHRMVRKGVLDLDADSARRSNSDVSTGTSRGDAVNVSGSIGSHYQPRREPGSGEVEVALQLATLGRDIVLPNASGEFAEAREGFGVVTRVGREVQQIQPGDDVFVYLNGKLGAHVTLQGASVFPLPKRAAGIIKDNAAYLPAFISAYYALRHVA